jgi:hypothetical protein
LVNPVTVAEVALPLALAVRPPGDEVTVYAVTALPPFDDGAAQLTVACALPAVAVTPVGAPGTVAGATEFDGAEAGPVPTALVAVTVKVYVVPLVSPVTVALVPLPLAVAVRPPGDDVTV